VAEARSSRREREYEESREKEMRDNVRKGKRPIPPGQQDNKSTVQGSCFTIQNEEHREKSHRVESLNGESHHMKGLIARSLLKSDLVMRGITERNLIGKGETERSPTTVNLTTTIVMRRWRILRGSMLLSLGKLWGKT
jgi:hypothetical protein